MYNNLRILLMTCGLVGCQSYTSQTHISPKLDDTIFPEYRQQAIETANDVFAIDAEIKKFVRKHTNRKKTDKAKLVSLVEAIFNSDNLSLSYNASANTTAKDTFKYRAANCLSLTIMTYSMAQSMGWDTQFQDVLIPEFWTRQDGKTLINTHINLVVNLPIKHISLLNNSPLIIDFDPLQRINRFQVKKLSQAEVLSDFYVNKAADFLIDNQPSPAYAYLRAAIMENNKNEGAWLNLGVLFSQNGYFERAAQYYLYAISLKPGYATARENLAILYRKIGETEKAEVQLAKIHTERLKNPYYYIMLGDVAFDDKTYMKAVQHYKKAISLNSSSHEFYFSAAKAYYAIGDLKNTQRFLRSAKRKTNDKRQEQRYASKISALIAMQ